MNAGSLLQAAPVARRENVARLQDGPVYRGYRHHLLSEEATRRDAAPPASVPRREQSLRKGPVGEPSL